MVRAYRQGLDGPVLPVVGGERLAALEEAEGGEGPHDLRGAQVAVLHAVDLGWMGWGGGGGGGWYCGGVGVLVCVWGRGVKGFTLGRGSAPLQKKA